MNTYQKWVEELGLEGAKQKMRELGSKGGKIGGGKAGFHTMDKTKLKKVSAKGGRSGKKQPVQNLQ